MSENNMHIDLFISCIYFLFIIDIVKCYDIEIKT